MRPPDEPDDEPEGGDLVCWAQLVCPECGAMTSEGHRPGCESAPPETGSAPPSPSS